MNIDLLVFGEDWGGHPSSTQHLMKHLLADNEVLWVNSLGLRRPRLNLRDMSRIWDKLKALLQAPTPKLSGAHPSLVNPMALPFPGSSLARTVNKELLTNKLRPYLKDQSEAPILWTSLPSAVDVVGKMGERAAIYYCGDDFSALDGVDHAPVAAMEEELVEKCQLIIAASPKLAEKFPAEKTLVLPHGVDCEMFGQPAERASDLPDGPVAGFYGALAGWFDQELYIEVARCLPHWTFVLIGPAHTDISMLLKQPNIVWLGPKPHHELPHYSQHWDVGLLPFLRNEQIEACNPLKLREYLAAGCPVVSTDFPALDGYRDLVKVSNAADGFAAAIEEIGNTEKHRELMKEIRRNRVNRESWTQRAEDLKEMLNDL
ncbi:glycosyltransferase [Neptuniibacter sp. PT8_73]|uniref:glycosyltransferase n=1 Tax=Neptuniibacter sp. PT8_73 TaxID=3398206 RepID=UPI0039F6292E